MQLQNRYVELKNITLSYGCRTILRDVNLLLNRGDFMIVSGANGGGKTSLIRIMLGLQKPTAGEVLYYGENSSHATIRGENIGYLPQKNSLDMSFPISIREVVESGLMNIKQPTLSEKREWRRCYNLCSWILFNIDISERFRVDSFNERSLLEQ